MPCQYAFDKADNVCALCDGENGSVVAECKISGSYTEAENDIPPAAPPAPAARRAAPPPPPVANDAPPAAPPRGRGRPRANPSDGAASNPPAPPSGRRPTPPMPGNTAPSAPQAAPPAPAARRAAPPPPPVANDAPPAAPISNGPVPAGCHRQAVPNSTMPSACGCGSKAPTVCVEYKVTVEDQGVWTKVGMTATTEVEAGGTIQNSCDSLLAMLKNQVEAEVFEKA